MFSPTNLNQKGALVVSRTNLMWSVGLKHLFTFLYSTTCMNNSYSTICHVSISCKAIYTPWSKPISANLGLVSLGPYSFPFLNTTEVQGTAVLLCN